NIRGEVIGINTAIVFGANSIGFAIPINTAKATVPMLISDGRVSRGYLGVSIDDAKNYDGVDTLGLPDMDGAVVRQVQPDTPAAKADLKTYDVIRKVNGEPVKTASELVRKISSFTPGTTVTLEVWRDKAQVNIEITLTERNVRENMRAAEKSVLGIRVQELAPQMLERMGMDKDLKGVVVINVDPGSPAEDARLMQGDIIIEVAQQPVTSPAEFFTTVEKHAEPGKSLLVRYVRGNNDPDITVIRVPKN
ncbi:MAG: PDZ domain-containing protein, partial [Candidatus Hydrogenedens sp.]|nr:PDZ domain-containing protein [Candidatus Hydrogenedens sp.]